MNKFLLVFISSTLFLNLSFSKTTFFISENKLKQYTKKYGDRATKRVLIWDRVMQKSKNLKVLKKLKNVNDFFNKIKYKRDINHWGKSDYWAAPFEFMGTGAGDCEDYAIAKYYSLLKLGIPEKKLRITYVKLLRKRTKFEIAHMVLTYYHKPGSTPIVLDNVNKKLTLASKRKDLKPIYSFNANGLWQAKNKGRTSIKIGSNNLKAWQSLMTRI
ncbi:MAG: transglutaminase-like cysteine peptidase [Campylobacteraceae bacterium]|nr:transglutaminase-like cysteine peptidase [Campylobacteraceae bacterium]